MITNFADIIFKNFNDAQDRARAWRDQNLQEREAARQDVQLGFQAAGNLRAWNEDRRGDERMDLSRSADERAGAYQEIQQQYADQNAEKYQYEKSRRPFAESVDSAQLESVQLRNAAEASRLAAEQRTFSERLREETQLQQNRSDLLTGLGQARQIFSTPGVATQLLKANPAGLPIEDPDTGEMKIVKSEEDFFDNAVRGMSKLERQTKMLLPGPNSRGEVNWSPEQTDLYSQLQSVQRMAQSHPQMQAAIGRSTARQQIQELAPELEGMTATAAGRYALTQIAPHLRRAAQGVPIPSAVLEDAFKIKSSGKAPDGWDDPMKLIKQADETIYGATKRPEEKISAIRKKQAALAQLGISYTDYSTGSAGAYQMGPIEELKKGNFGAGTPKPDSKPGSLTQDARSQFGSK